MNNGNQKNQIKEKEDKSRYSWLVLIAIPIISILIYLFFSKNLGYRQSIALAHMITAIVSAILIIYLAIQFRIKQKILHKEIAYLMAVFGILSLYFSFVYGFSLKISTEMKDLHNIFGFIALGLSLIPIAVKPGGKYKLHCRLATVAALFAILSIITGFLAYTNLIYKIIGISL